MFLFSCTNTTFQINQKDLRVPLLLFFTKYIQKILNTTEGGRSGVDNDNHVLCFHGTYRPMVVVVVVEDVDANVLCCCCRGQCCISSIVKPGAILHFFLCALPRSYRIFYGLWCTPLRGPLSVDVLAQGHQLKMLKLGSLGLSLLLVSSSPG